jgi:hypothetical protein
VRHFDAFQSQRFIFVDKTDAGTLTSDWAPGARLSTCALLSISLSIRCTFAFLHSSTSLDSLFKPAS